MLSINFNSDTINIVDGKFSSNKIIINKSVSICTPEASIINGRVNDREKLILAINSELLKHNFKNKKASVIINSPDIKTKNVTVPDAKRSDILQILQTEIKNIVSDEQEHLIDYTINDSFKKEKLKYHNVTMIAIPKRLILEYCEILKSCNLIPVIFDTYSNVILKMMQNNYANIKREFVQLNVGLYQDEIKLSIYDNDSNYFFKTVLIDNYDVSNSGLLNMDAINGNNVGIEKQSRLIDLYIENINNIIQFQNYQNPNKKISIIKTYGQCAEIQNLNNLIALKTGVQTINIEKPKGLKSKKNLDHIKYYCAIGGLIRR